MNEAQTIAIFLGCLLAFFAALALVIGVFCLIVLWIIGPLDEAGHGHDGDVYLTDFFCLFGTVQLPLTAFNLLGKEAEVVVAFMLWGVATFFWWLWARTLSNADFPPGWQRTIFLGFALPMVFYGLLPFVVLTWIGTYRLIVYGVAGLICSWPWLVAWMLLGAALAASWLFTWTTLSLDNDWLCGELWLPPVYQSGKRLERVRRHATLVDNSGKKSVFLKPIPFEGSLLGPDHPMFWQQRR